MGCKKSNGTYNRNIRYIILLPLFTALFFLSFVPAALSQGEIYNIRVDPEEPFVLDDFIINIGVRNTGNELSSYVLDVFVLKNGQIRYENSFTFLLNPNKGILFSPTFMPSSVGDYKIVAKLFDNYKSVLYDTMVLEVEVISDIGPFDVYMDTLSRTVRPGYEIPLMLRLKNVGIKGTDVKIAVSIDCIEHEDIYKEFFVFLKGSGDLDKTLSIPACNEEGIRDITAKLILFDHTYAESLSQVFINRTYYDFYVEYPKSITLKQGESEVFDVFIKNTAEISVNNLRLLVENIPVEWTEISPSIIMSIKPNETAMFIVNITVPIDASVIEYPITMAIGSDETLVQKDSTLKVVTGEFVVPEEEEEGPLIPKDLQYKLIIISIVGVVVIVLIAVFSKLKSKRSRKREKAKRDVLGKVKDMIGQT